MTNSHPAHRLQPIHNAILQDADNPDIVLHRYPMRQASAAQLMQGNITLTTAMHAASKPYDTAVKFASVQASI
jgi:hypothetical protein